MESHRTVSVGVLLALASTAAVVSAQPLAFTRIDAPSVAGARGIATGDFDRNGLTDVAHANFGRNTVSVLLNQGGSPPSFVVAHDIAVGAGPFDLATADFDRNGILDLAVTNADGHTISVLLGRATGGFARTDLAAPRGPRGIAAADVNDDGRADLIVTGWDANAVQVLLGNGAGGFATGPAVTGLASRPQGVAAADFNRDGHLDVAVAHESAGGLAVLTGNGGSAFTLQAIPGITNLNVVATGDFNRDGRTDVAAASTSGNRVGLYLGTDSGLRFNASYPTGSSPRDLVARDINHDGALDVVTANRNADNVSVLLGSTSAPGTLEPAETFPAGNGSRVVAAEDFDHDGRVDLVTGNQDASSVTFLWNDTLFDRAGYSFSRQSFGTPSGETGGSPALPVDFNEDGQLDVLVKPNFEQGPVFHVLITGGPVVALEQPEFHSVAVTGDFNDDGHADVLTMPSFGRVRIASFLGNGRGGFTRGPDTEFGIEMHEIAVGDLNRDGTEDLALLALEAESYVLGVLTGQGDGSFQLGSRVPASDRFGFTSALRIADVNRDGRLDVALLVVGELVVFHGDGAGSLELGSRASMANFSLQQLVLKDVNHDGWLDAIASNGDGVRLSLGSAGGFGTRVLIGVQAFSSGTFFAVEDIDLDGHQDIVGAVGVILRGMGNGEFGPAESFDFNSQLVRVVDFTGDGLPDIVMPTSNGAFDVAVNRRNSVNGAPAVSAGPDRTFEYADQFEDEPFAITAVGTDPDLHGLAYQWQDEAGNAVDRAFGQFLLVEGLAHGTHTFTVTVRDGRGGIASDSMTLTILPTKEIVLWSASGFHHGTFSEVADSTAAGGERGHDSNLGRPKVNAPAPEPLNFIDLGFVADPTQTYKLWIRLKADSDRWNNDSVWVQFTGSVDAAGNAVFRPGSSSGLAVNLEECVNCGVSGWGWEDDGWGTVDRNGVTLRFPGGGFQRIIIQTREDGVSIDQVVLSSEKYLTKRPGTAKNDNTILPFTFFQQEG